MTLTAQQRLQRHGQRTTPLYLAEAATLWQTPKDTTGGNVSRGHDRKDEPLLAGQAKMWATPDAGVTGAKDAANRQGGPSRQAQATAQAG